MSIITSSAMAHRVNIAAATCSGFPDAAESVVANQRS